MQARGRKNIRQSRNILQCQKVKKWSESAATTTAAGQPAVLVQLEATARTAALSSILRKHNGSS